MVEAFNNVLKTFQERDLFSGVVLLARDGHPIYQKACGYANRVFNVANRIETRFATASVTKMFTAAAVMNLIDNGDVQLNTPVTRYLGLEECQISKQITVEHLLTHMSGIADYFDDGDPNGFENLWLSIGSSTVDRPSRLLPLFMDERQITSPGESFDYNGAGYILLGLIIEKASGLHYEDYIRKYIFRRAGMNHSDFIPMNRVVLDVAEGYIPLRDGNHSLLGWKRNIYSVPAYGLPDGGAYCTAWDLVHFLRALRDGRLLSRTTQEAMCSPVIPVSRSGRYGYGVWCEMDDERIIRYGHTGEDPGVSARAYHYPIFNLDLVILGNQSYCAGELDSQMHRILIEQAEDEMGGISTP